MDGETTVEGQVGVVGGPTPTGVTGAPSAPSGDSDAGVTEVEGQWGVVGGPTPTEVTTAPEAEAYPGEVGDAPPTPTAKPPPAPVPTSEEPITGDIGTAERAEQIVKLAEKGVPESKILTPGEKMAGYKVTMARSYMQALSKAGVTPAEITGAAKATESRAIERAEGKFVLPEGSKVVELSAKGKPTVYLFRAERYYTPASTMWDYGFRTSEEYRKAQQYYGSEGTPYGPHSGKNVPKGGGGGIIVESGKELVRLVPGMPGWPKGQSPTSSVIRGYIKRGQYWVPVQTDKGEVLVTPKQVEILRRAEATKRGGYSAVRAEEIAKGAPLTRGEKMAGITIEQAKAYVKAIKEAGTTPLEITEQAQFEAELMKSDPELLKIYRAKGIEGYNKEVKKRQAEFEAELKKSDPELYKNYKEKGIEWYNKEVESRHQQWLNELKQDFPSLHKILVEKGEAAFEAALARGEKILARLEKRGCVVPPDKKGDSPSYDLIKAFEKYGFKKEDLKLVFPDEDVDKSYKIHIAQFEAEPKFARMGAKGKEYPQTVSDQEYAWLVRPPDISKADYLKMAPHITPKEIDVVGAINAGASDKTIKAVTGATNAELEEFHWFAEYDKANFAKQQAMAMAKAVKELPSKPPEEIAGQASIVAAEIMVPGVYLASHWNELSPGEKAFFIAIDVACLVPIFTAGAMGARAVATASRTARMMGAAREAGRAGLALVRAPVVMVIHPIATAKATASQLRTLAENIAHPLKLPEAVITTSSKAIKLRVTEATNPQQARDMVMELAKSGERPIIRVGDTEIELARSPLMKEAKGGLVHATPDGELLVKGTKVKAKPGMPVEEQGLFVSNEPSIQFAEQSAFGKNSIPVPTKASGQVGKVGKYKAADLVKIDAHPIRALNFADAQNVPGVLSPKLEAYARQNRIRQGGSFNEWLKNPKAARPNDLDWAVRNQEKALNDVLKMAKTEGLQARRVEHAVEWWDGKKWAKIVDIDTIAHHNARIPAGLAQPARPINGIRVETLGEQYLRQSYGAVSEMAKASERAKKVEKAAKLVEQRLKEEGAIIMKPGIIIYSPKTAERAVATRKLYKGTAEMEEKFRVGEILPEVKQRLFTRVGPTAERVEIWLEKPLSAIQIAKLKARGLVEWVITPFKPAIRVDKVIGVGLRTEQANELVKILKQSGNAHQAKNLVRIERLARASRQAPPALARVTGLAARRPSVSRITRATPRARIAPRVSRTAGTVRLTSVARAYRELARIERAERLLRGERVARGGRIERVGRLQRIARGERVERTGRVSRIERVERPVRPVRLTRPTRPTRPVRPIRPTRPTRPVRPIKPLLPRGIPKGEPTPAQLKNAVAWPQGFGWWVVYSTKGKQLQRKFFHGQQAPQGVKDVQQGPREAYRGIQRKFGKGVEATMPMGAFHVEIDNPEARPGKVGAIEFTPVSERSPAISQGGVHLPGRSTPRITPKRPRIQR